MMVVKAKKGQADGEQLRTEAGKGFAEGDWVTAAPCSPERLASVRRINQRGGGADQDGVDEHADKCRQALLKQGGLRRRLRARAASNPYLLRWKQSACHAVTDGFAHTEYPAAPPNTASGLKAAVKMWLNIGTMWSENSKQG